MRAGDAPPDKSATPKKSCINHAREYQEIQGQVTNNISTENHRRHIPTRIKREVWKRASSRCQNCGSAHGLEIDHVIPVARGGGDEPENLRLLCRSCNQRHAVETYGVQFMNIHFESR